MSDWKQAREQEFFEWFEKIQAIADKNEVSFYAVMNARQIWDTAYASGVAQALKEQLDKAKN
jgi:hypothetical protein